MYKNFTLPIGTCYAPAISKFIRVMKVTCSLILFFIIHAGASIKAQNITIKVKNVSLEWILKDIQQQSGYSLFYDEELINKAQRVTLDVKNVSINEALDKCLYGQPINYVINNKIITLKARTNEVKPKTQAPPIKVTGRVSDEKGEPVPGTSVKLKNTTIGAVADSKGNYSITIPDQHAVLVFSSIGYDPLEIAVGTHNQLDIKLHEQVASLNSVVVVGYGSQRKRDVTGALASVSGATLQEAPSANFVDQLKGRTAGVSIVSNGSGLGNSNQIRIRGSRALSTSSSELNSLDQPLIVVDGIPFGGSINDLDQDNVQSLEILKDASSTAIYGSRGSGGVILVTTKRGVKGKSVVSYNAYYGNSNILGEYKVFNGPEYAQFLNYSAQLNTLAPTSSATFTPTELAGIANGTSTDWQKLIFKTGHTSDQSINISGGNENTQFGVGAGYLTQTAVIPNQNYRRYSLRTTIDHKISNHVKVGVNTLNTLSYNNDPGGTSSLTQGLLRISPLTSPYNADGTVNMFPQAGSVDATTANPLTLITSASSIYSQTRRLRTFNSLYGEVNIIDGLKYRLNIGLDFTQSNGGSYTGPNTYANSRIITAAQATTAVSNNEAYSYTFEHLLTYDKTIAQKHHLTFTGLFSTQKDHSMASQFSGLGLPADYILNSNLALASSISASTTGNTFSERGLISEMARLNYAYNGRYLLTATVRRDGSSVLAPGHQYLTYPALALGWNIINEGWMKGITAINNLKLRASYGTTGDQGSNPYQTLGALGQSYYNFGTTTAGQQTAYVVNQLGNTNLTWQSTRQFNLGLDFGVLKNRVTGSIDIYSQKTSNIIVTNVLPASNGATSQIVNFAQTGGKGLELNLSSINIRSNGGFTWTTDFNISFDRNKVLTLPNGILNDITDGWFVGQPSSVIYDFKKLGIWQTGDPGLKTQTSPVQIPGQIKVQDSNNDGKITADDEQIIGNFQPKYEAGLTNRVSYKNFDLSVVAYARMGMKVVVPYLAYNSGLGGYAYFLQGRNNQVKVDYWTPINPTNAFPKPDGSAQGPVYSSTTSYVDGSFIKVRSINLGYTIPSKLLERAGITSLRVYFTAENPFILYSPFVKAGYGTDPEGNGYGGAAAAQGGAGGSPSRQISVSANNPSVRNFNLGINLKL